MGELHAKLVGPSRGSIHIRIGNDHPDSLITYPDVHNLSACAQPIRIMPRRWGCGSWRCLQMVVWLGLATRSKESAGVEGAGGGGRPGCGVRERWRGLAGQRADAPSEARGADGSRAGRRPRAHKAARPNNAHPAPETPVARQASWPDKAHPASGTPARPQTAKPPGPTGAGRLGQYQRLIAGSRRCRGLRGHSPGEHWKYRAWRQRPSRFPPCEDPRRRR